MKLPVALCVLALLTGAAHAQTSLAACGPLPDSTAKQVIKTFGDMRVCLLATKLADADGALPRDWAARGAMVVMETQRPNDNRRISIQGLLVENTVNGQPARVDAAADRWQTAVLDLLDAKYQADELRTRAANLREQIDSLPVRIQATRDRIDRVEKQQAALNMQISAAQSRENSTRQDISRLEGERAQYERRASEEETRAANARDERTRQSAESRARQWESQAQRVSAQIRRMEQGLRQADAAKTVAAASEELRALRPEHTLSLLHLQLETYESTNLQDLEQQLIQLDAPRRLTDLDAQVEKARLALLDVLEARGRAPSP